VTPPEALQPLAARRLRDADRGFHAARRAGLPRQDRERRDEGRGHEGQILSSERPLREKTGNHLDGIDESPQSGLTGAGSRIVVHDDADNGIELGGLRGIVSAR
jgi:hypothetical protein